MTGRRTSLLIVVMGLLAGCDQMAVQKRDNAFGAAALFADGKTLQAPPDGAIARDMPAAARAESGPPPMSPALVARGAQRYAIYCTPCHDGAGYGQGIVAQRGFPAPQSFLNPAMRALTDAQVVAAIRDGHGVMYGFGDRIAPADRWAIAAYVRSLQISQSPAGAGAVTGAGAGRAADAG